MSNYWDSPLSNALRAIEKLAEALTIYVEKKSAKLDREA